MRGPQVNDGHHHLRPDAESGYESTNTDPARTAELPFFAAGVREDEGGGETRDGVGRSFAIEIRHAVVLDDSPDVRKSLERMLSSLPCLVQCASDTDGACELLRRFQPDLALVDVFLDRNDKRSGLDAISRMRTLAPDLVIGGISAAMNAALAAECIEAGADWALAKPFRKGALLEAVCSGRRRVPTMLRTDLPLETIKQLYIERVMAECNGNKCGCARARQASHYRPADDSSQGRTVNSDRDDAVAMSTRDVP
jgi:CheY-like chemotaxis protein